MPRSLVPRRLRPSEESRRRASGGVGRRPHLHEADAEAGQGRGVEGVGPAAAHEVGHGVDERRVIGVGCAVEVTQQLARLLTGEDEVHDVVGRPQEQQAVAERAAALLDRDGGEGRLPHRERVADALDAPGGGPGQDRDDGERRGGDGCGEPPAPTRTGQ